MIKAADIYPDYTSEHFYEPSSYQPIIDAIGTPAVRVDDDDCQGDSRILYRDGDRWGWLQFGWGSCSGCDALQACENPAELQSLIDHLESSVRWFESTEEAAAFFSSHDWKGDYSWHHKEQQEFIEQCCGALEIPVPECMSE